MKMIKFISLNRVTKWISWWPPYMGTGIKVKKPQNNFTLIEVELKQRFYNTNYVGSHFGGSLYSMCDPFYMFILLEHLGKDHLIWDKSAHIEYIKPGKGKLRVKFEIKEEQLESLRKKALEEFKILATFTSDILNDKNEVIAKITKELYIRRKDAKTRFHKEK